MYHLYRHLVKVDCYCVVIFSVDHLSKYLAIRLSLESKKVDAGMLENFLHIFKVI